jgi:hypothetical protein
MMAMTMPHRRPSRPSSIPAADDTRDPAPIPDDRVPIAVWHLGIDAHDECDSSSKDKASLYAQESKRQEVFVVDCLLLDLLKPFPNPTRCSPRPRRCARTGCPYRVPCTDLHTPKHPQNDIFRQFHITNPPKITDLPIKIRISRTMGSAGARCRSPLRSRSACSRATPSGCVEYSGFRPTASGYQVHRSLGCLL